MAEPSPVATEGSRSRMSHDGNAVVTSQDKITYEDYSDFLDENWRRLMLPGTTLFVLTGVHASSNGNIVRVDENLVEEDRMKKNELLKKHKEHAAENNVRIEVLDIGPVWQRYEHVHKNLDWFKLDLVKSIEDLEKEAGVRATTILLAYCFSQCNVVADLLRLSSMCSRLVLERDRYELCGHRTWSEEQQRALQAVAANPTQPFIVTGDYGTGKTIMAIGKMKMG